MGANPDVKTSDPHVFYTGSQPPEVYLQVFAVANWMLHLAWADHCPNVVIESLCQGTPVVCTDVGGTRELVGDFGSIIKDSPYNFELADYDNPPELDVSGVKLPDKVSLGSHADIDIRSVADRYISFFEELLK
jgi:glycosyltransferase involved in cell wall biosynthesis